MAESNIFAINCGAHEQFIDSANCVWLADQKYSRQNKWGYLAGTPIRSHHRIFGTQDDPLYQTAVNNGAGYRFDIPDGEYKITLKIAAISQCDFPLKQSCSINDLPVHYQISKPYTAVIISKIINVKDSKGLEIKFLSGSDQNFINAIKIEKV